MVPAPLPIGRGPGPSHFMIQFFLLFLWNRVLRFRGVENLRIEVYRPASFLTLLDASHSPCFFQTRSIRPTPRGPGLRCFLPNPQESHEARANAFEDIHPADSNAGASAATLKLGGGKDCMVNAVKVSPSVDAGTQFVCYWQEASASAAEVRFRDLVSRLQVLVPSNWSTRQENELDDPTGASLTAWHADEPGNKHDVRVYLSGDFVGLHITPWK
jgi:hypothetical protein